MAINYCTPPAPERFLVNSQSSVNLYAPYQTRLYCWPAGRDFLIFRPDAYLWQGALSSDQQPTDHSLADQVFGNQRRQEYLNLTHLANLLYERASLHKQHLRDIDHRHIQIQEDLFGVRINNSPDKARRQSNLENQLLQLEGQRRDEELAFWKDSVDLREKLFDTASTYKAAKHRYSVFAAVEDGDAI